MNDGGWVKVYRKITEWEWYSDPWVFRVFTHLLLTANYEPGKWQGITIEPGQKVTSLPHLAQETGLSIQQTRTALDKLKSTGEITVKASNKFSIITINKWQEYQADNRQINSQATDDQHANEQPSNNNRRNKETKKGRKKEEKNTEGEETRSLALATPADEAIRFFTDLTSQETVVGYLIQKGMPDALARQEIGKFVRKWTEPNKTGTKQRWQMEKTFEVKRRLTTWMQNAATWSGQKSFIPQEPKGIRL